MNYSREQIQEELKRRNLPLDIPVGSNSQFSKTQLIDELKKRNLPLKKETKGWSGIAQDIGKSGSEFFGDLADIFTNPEVRSQYAQAIKREGLGAASQLYNEPKRVGMNLYQGLASGAQGLINTPSNIYDYLARKEIISPEEEGNFPIKYEGEPIVFPELRKQKAGDVFLQKVTELLPYISGGEIGLGTSGLPRKLTQRSGAQALHALGQNEDPLKAALGMATGELGIKGLGATALGTKEAIKTIPKVAKTIPTAYKNVKGSYPVEKVGKSVLNRGKALKEEIGAGFENVINEAESSGINNAFLSNINESEILKYANSKESKLIKDFLENPNKSKIEEIKKTLVNISKRSEDISSPELIQLPKGVSIEPAENATKDAIKAFTKELNKNILKIPKKRTYAIMKKGSSDEITAIKNALKNPTIENLHSGQSELGHLERSLKSKKDKTGMDKNALKQANELKELFRKQIKNNLIKNGRPDLADNYTKLLSRHKEEYIPYEKSLLVKKLKEGDILPEDFYKSALTDKYFKARIMKHHPEFKIREGIKHAAKAIPGAYLGYKGLQKLGVLS